VWATVGNGTAGLSLELADVFDEDTPPGLLRLQAAAGTAQNEGLWDLASWLPAGELQGVPGERLTVHLPTARAVAPGEALVIGIIATNAAGLDASVRVAVEAMASV
jgi:hypothetical protein